MTGSAPTNPASVVCGLETLLRIHHTLAAVLAGAGHGAPAAPRIVGAFGESLGWACGTLWSRDADAADRLVCAGAWGVDTPASPSTCSTHSAGGRAQQRGHRRRGLVVGRCGVGGGHRAGRHLPACADWYWEQDAQHRFIRFEGRGVGRNGADLAPALVGRCQWDVKGMVPASSDWDEHRGRLARREAFRDLETVYRDPKGEMVHISANGDPMHDTDGQFTGYRGTARDVTLHKQAAQRIQYLSTHDELTGLPNRAALRQLVTQAVELAKRYGRCFAILLLNLDRFQRMNDSLGREAGDALLRELGARLKKQLRASDVGARLDGDDFAVLAHELLMPQQAEPIGRKLLDAVHVPMLLQGHGEFRITASVGIAACPMDGSDERTLMKHAALALRAAKKQGLNQLHFHQALSSKSGRSAA